MTGLAQGNAWNTTLTRKKGGSGTARKSANPKGAAASKIWRLAKTGTPRIEIAREVGYTATKVNQFLQKRFAQECDNLWKLHVRARANNRCEICGKSPCDAHHLLEKSVWKQYRWHPMNGVLLCKDHHKFNVECSPHATVTSAVRFTTWLLQSGLEQGTWYANVRDMARGPLPDPEETYFEW